MLTLCLPYLVHSFLHLDQSFAPILAMPRYPKPKGGPNPDDPRHPDHLSKHPDGLKKPRFSRHPRPGGLGERRFQAWRPAFIEALAESGSIAVACATVGISLRTYNVYRRDYPDFEEEALTAMIGSNAALEESALGRATHGVEEPVFYKGKICGYVRRYDNKLTMFMLERRIPEMYGPPQTSRTDEANELAHLIHKSLSELGGTVPLLDAPSEPTPVADISDTVNHTGDDANNVASIDENMIHTKAKSSRRSLNKHRREPPRDINHEDITPGKP